MKQYLTAFALLIGAYTQAQMLGIYQFTGAGACPNQNEAVTAQPSNAQLVNFSALNVVCNSATDVYNFQGWNTAAAIDLSEYIEFSIFPDPCYRATLDSLIFSFRNSPAGGTPDWHLRSSEDNFMTDLATGTSTTTLDSDTIVFPGNFATVNDVTFRFYLTNMGNTAATWRVDDVQLFGSINFFGTTDFYLDADADGFGTGPIVAMCDNPGGYATVAGDCDDNNPLINPATVWYADVDNDGFGDMLTFETACTPSLTNATMIGQDCDDANPAISTSAIGGTYTITDATPCVNQTFSNTLTGFNGTIDWSLSNDGGMTWTSLGSNQAVFTTSVPNPGTPALVAAIVSYPGCPNDTSNVITVQVLPMLTWYADGDGDGFGDNANTLSDCEQPLGYVSDNTDCDDSDANINPNTLWFADVDGDGFGDPNVTETACVSTLQGATLDNSDCNDADQLINPNTVWHPDNDADGFGDPNLSEIGCVPSFFVPVLDGTDCDDTRDYVYPGATEVCDEFDNNCNGTTDEGFTKTTYYIDFDHDGFGDGSAGQFCSDPGIDYSITGGDCDDVDPLIYPGAMDAMGDLIDQNCDGVDGNLGLEEVALKTLPIFPNPGTDKFFLSTENLKSGVNLLVITDLQGKVIFAEELNIDQSDFIEIDAKAFEKGVYQLSVSNNQQVLRASWVKL